MQVLYEDNHVLAVVKPAGLPTMGVAEGEKSLLSEAKKYVAQKYAKPGNVYLGIVSRLDTPTTGVVVIARTSKAASRLSEQFKNRTVQKTYFALVEGRVPHEEGTLRDRLAEEKRHRKMFVTRSAEGVEAILHYRVAKRYSTYTLLEIHLETGRKHQIRLQISHAGFPILGDRKYGAKTSFPVGIALHAGSLVFRHPTLGEEIKIEADFPATWKKFL